MSGSRSTVRGIASWSPLNSLSCWSARTRRTDCSSGALGRWWCRLADECLACKAKGSLEESCVKPFRRGCANVGGTQVLLRMAGAALRNDPDEQVGKSPATGQVIPGRPVTFNVGSPDFWVGVSLSHGIREDGTNAEDRLEHRTSPPGKGSPPVAYPGQSRLGTGAQPMRLAKLAFLDLPRLSLPRDRPPFPRELL